MNKMSLSEKQGLEAVLNLKEQIEAQGYSVIHYNSWAISFCDKSELNSKYRDERLMTLASGTDTEKATNKTNYKYTFRKHFIIKESTNNPNALPQIIVSRPASLEQEKHYLFVRPNKHNLDDASVILCGAKPDYRGDGRGVDYKVLDSGGNIIEIPSNTYKSGHTLHMKEGNTPGSYEIYQEIPMFLFKNQKTHRKIKDIQALTYPRKYAFKYPHDYGDTEITEEVRKNNEFTYKDKPETVDRHTYKIQKIVMMPLADGTYGLNYVVIAGPRDGDIICDAYNFEMALSEFNRIYNRRITISELINIYNNYRKVYTMSIMELEKSQYLNTDKNISQRVIRDSNIELRMKIAKGLKPEP